MKGIGLVFAGGGGKGAYEIGIWKYLHELGIDQYVQAVSGTSVGALNAALFVGSDFEDAEQIWLSIEREKVLAPKEISIEEIMEWLSDGTLGGIVSDALGPDAPFLLGKVTHTIRKLALSISLLAFSDYRFSNKGLRELINQGIDFDRLNDSGIPCFVTCLKYPYFSTERFKLNGYKPKDVISLLLASSAIPFVFKPVKYKGEYYCDGGVPGLGDNIPIAPVYDYGVENIIVIHLSQDAYIDKALFPKARIFEVFPSVDLGDALTGTLDFTPDGAERRISLGYKDAKEWLKPMLENLSLSLGVYNAYTHAAFGTSMCEKQNDFHKQNEITRMESKKRFDEMRNMLRKGQNDD